MKLHALLTLTALSISSQAAVTFTETFESPGGAFSADGNINLPSGTYGFDNPGWQVTSFAPAAVFYVQDPTSTQVNTGSRAIAFGGAGTTGSNRIQVTIAGFTGQTITSLSYGHFSSGNQGQGIRITLLDSIDSSTLYTADHFSNGSVSGLAFTLPTSDSIIFRAEQIGNTTGSDSGIDNISITAIPEPGSALLGLLGGLFLVRSRRA